MKAVMRSRPLPSIQASGRASSDLLDSPNLHSHAHTHPVVSQVVEAKAFFLANSPHGLKDDHMQVCHEDDPRIRFTKEKLIFCCSARATFYAA